MANRVRFRTKTVYKNKNGSIVSEEDTIFGGTRFLLLDANLNFVKELHVPFCCCDYL